MTTTTTAAGTDTGPQTPPVEPFKASFDYDENYCARDVDIVLDELASTNKALADELATVLAGKDGDDAHTAVTALVEALDASGDDSDEADERRIDLEEVAAQLTYCETSCMCASDAYEGWGADYLNNALAELGDHVWAITHAYRDREYRDGDDTLTMEQLFDVSALRSWSQADLDWDGTRLQVKLAGYHGDETLLLHPLTSEEVDLFRWYTNEQDHDHCAADIRAKGAAVYAAARTIWQAHTEPWDVFDDLAELVTAVSEAGPQLAASADPAVIARLAPTWKLPLKDLLLVACDLAPAA